MKKILVVLGVVSVLIVALGVAGFAYAQTQNPPNPNYPFGPGMMGDGYGRGYGRGYGHGMMGNDGDGNYGGMMGWNGKEGPMHEAMVTALAEALDLTSEEIEARHDNGESMWQIAADSGLSDEEIQDLMFSAHDQALADAVANGLLSEEQAEWMDAHMEQMWNGEYPADGFGSHCGGGLGRWQDDD